VEIVRVFLALNDIDRVTGRDGRDHFRQAIENGLDAVQIPNPAALAVRSSLLETRLAVIADGLMYQAVAGRVGVVIGRVDLLTGRAIPRRGTPGLILLDKSLMAQPFAGGAMIAAKCIDDKVEHAAADLLFVVVPTALFRFDR